MDGSCYETYLSFCSAYSLRPPWETLKAPWAYRTPAAGENVLERLLARHDDASLLACGLAIADPEGRQQINPLLAQPDAPIIALAGPEGVSDLLTAGGCIRGERWPLFGVLDDEHAREAIGHQLTTVLLTADVDDAIVLRAIGWIAAPVLGLGEFDQRELELLAKHYGLRTPASAPADPLLRAPGLDEPLSASLARVKADLEANHLSFDEFARGAGAEYADAEYLELVLSEWSPRTLSLAEPAAVSRAAERLRELANFRRIDLLDVGEWRPTSDDLRRIRFAAERGEAGWLREAMLKSLEDSSWTLGGPLPVAAPATPARSPLEQLEKALADDEPGAKGRLQRQEALERCYRAAANRVIGQLLAQVDTEPDPLRCALILQYAELTELLRDKMAAVRRSFRIDRPDASTKKTGRDPKIAEVLNIGNQLLAVARELNQCIPPRNHYWAKLASPTISFPPFGS